MNALSVGLAQPGLELIDDRSAPVLAHGSPLIGVAAPDVLLDGIETGDAFERLAGDRRRAGGREFVEAAADMRPAEGKLYRKRCFQATSLSDWAAG